MSELTLFLFPCFAVSVCPGTRRLTTSSLPTTRNTTASCDTNSECWHTSRREPARSTPTQLPLRFSSRADQPTALFLPAERTTCFEACRLSSHLLHSAVPVALNQQKHRNYSNSISTLDLAIVIRSQFRIPWNSRSACLRAAHCCRALRFNTMLSRSLKSREPGHVCLVNR